ncbi:hypothetical protein HDK77DRAFT_429136 [Phyllosticta capitalensis]
MSENGDLDVSAYNEAPCRLPSGELLRFKTTFIKGKHWGEVDVTVQYQTPNLTDWVDIAWSRGFFFNRDAGLFRDWNFFGPNRQPIPQHVRTFLRCAFDGSGKLKDAIVEVEDSDSDGSEGNVRVMPGTGAGERHLGDAANNTPQMSTTSTNSLHRSSQATNLRCIGEYSFLMILHLTVDINWRRKAIATRICNVMNRLAVYRYPTLKFSVVWPLGSPGDHELTPAMKAANMGPDQLGRIAQMTAKGFYRALGFVPLGTSRWYVRNLDDYRRMIQIEAQRTPQERAERARRFGTNADLADLYAVEMAQLPVQLPVQDYTQEQAQPMQVAPVVVQQTNPPERANPRVTSVAQLLNHDPTPEQTQIVQAQPANRTAHQSANLTQHQTQSLPTQPTDYPGQQLAQHDNHVSQQPETQSMETPSESQVAVQWIEFFQNEIHLNEMEAMQAQPATIQQQQLDFDDEQLANTTQNIETNFQFEADLLAAQQLNSVPQHRNDDFSTQQQMQFPQTQPAIPPEQQGSNVNMPQETQSESPMQSDEYVELSVDSDIDMSQEPQSDEYVELSDDHDINMPQETPSGSPFQWGEYDELSLDQDINMPQESQPESPMQSGEDDELPLDQDTNMPQQVFVMLGSGEHDDDFITLEQLHPGGYEELPLDDNDNIPMTEDGQRISPIQADEHGDLVPLDYNDTSSYESALEEHRSTYHSLMNSGEPDSNDPNSNNPNNVFSDPEERRLASIGDEQIWGDFWADVDVNRDWGDEWS